MLVVLFTKERNFGGDAGLYGVEMGESRNFVCRDEFDLSIRYLSGDTMWACRRKSLELDRDVR